MKPCLEGGLLLSGQLTPADLVKFCMACSIYPLMPVAISMQIDAVLRHSHLRHYGETKTLRTAAALSWLALNMAMF